MTIILRLQGLDVKAGTEDIRTFFEGLHIPGGGVYIIGGSLREAFIAFTSEREAQLAMRYTGKHLKGSNVTLHISSMKELEQRLKSLLKVKKHSSMQKRSLNEPQSSQAAVAQPLNVNPKVHKRVKPSPSQKRPQSSGGVIVPPLNACTNVREKLSPQASLNADGPPLNTHPEVHNSNTDKLSQLLIPDDAKLQPSIASSLDAKTAFILGICTVLQRLQPSLQSENSEAAPGVPNADNMAVSEKATTPQQTVDSCPGYVRLFGLPPTTTKQDICHFFTGLTVQEAIVNVKLGRNHVCLVKFASMQDACDALRFNKQSLGPISVEVRAATEKMWTSMLQECETSFDVGERVKPKYGPLRRTENHKQKNISALQRKRESVNRQPSKLHKKPRRDGDSIILASQTMEYIVRVSNIPKNMTKTDIKELFDCPSLPHRNVLHLLDEERNRTDTAFVVFNHIEDYEYAMNLTGCHVGSDAIKVTSITKTMMWDMIAQTRPTSLEHYQKTDAKRRPDPKRKSDPVEPPE